MRINRMDLQRMDLQLFAEGEPAQEPAQEPNQEPASNEPATNQDGGEKPEKTFSQEELDAVITKRLARERKAWETQLEEEKKKAAMTETERLQAEKEEAEKLANETMSKANRMLVTAEAKSVASTLGVIPERLNYAIKLADLDAIEVQDGEVDLATIEKAISKVLEDVPELKGKSERSIGSGTNPGTQASRSADMNAFIRRSAGR